MTDKELIGLIKKNKDKGLSKAIDLYSPLIYKVVSSVILPVGSKQDAEECVSDTFLAFYEAVDRFDLEKASIKTYLAVIGKRKAIDLYRTLKKRSENEAVFDDSESEKESFTLTFERKNAIMKAVKALGEPDTSIITRRYFLGETAKEIGKALGLSQEAVQKRIERSKQKLKTELGGVFNG